MRMRWCIKLAGLDAGVALFLWMLWRIDSKVWQDTSNAEFNAQAITQEASWIVVKVIYVQFRPRCVEQVVFERLLGSREH